MSLKYAPLVFPFLAVSVIFPTPSMAQQVADTLFVPAVAAPAFSERTGSPVLIDEGHHNLFLQADRGAARYELQNLYWLTMVGH